MIQEPNYIVVRGTGGPSDGVWLDLNDVPPASPDERQAVLEGMVQVISAYPTGMIERRDSDGAIAEIWAPKHWVVTDP